MAGFSSGKLDEPITQINVTPLVDIALVLLIIFMVTAKLVVSRAIPMDLPRAATGDQVQEILSVSLGEDGSTSVNGEAVAGALGLHKAARDALAQTDELRAVIRGDIKVPHGRVMTTLDVLRQAGVSRIAFAVMPGQTLDVDSADTETPAQAPPSTPTQP